MERRTLPVFSLGAGTLIAPAAVFVRTRARTIGSPSIRVEGRALIRAVMGHGAASTLLAAAAAAATATHRIDILVLTLLSLPRRAVPVRPATRDHSVSESRRWSRLSFPS